MAYVSLNVRFDAIGFDQSVWRLNNIVLWNLWRTVGNEFVTMTKENMGASGGPRPAPWPPLSKRYAKTVSPPVPTLLRSGRLRNSIGHKADQNGVVVFSDSPYASVHQFGSSPQLGLFHHSGTPARKYFPIFGGQNGGPVELTPYAQARLQTAIVGKLAMVFRNGGMWT